MVEDSNQRSWVVLAMGKRMVYTTSLNVESFNFPALLLLKCVFKTLLVN